MRIFKKIFPVLCVLICVLCFTQCSTTSKLPEGEYLYTGIKSVNVQDKGFTPEEAVALEEMQGALDYAPNNSLFGSSSMRFPLPIGLWIYNQMGDEEHKGIKKWFFNSFAAKPRTITSAAPDTRVKVAHNVLENYGYFFNKVSYNLVPQKNPRMQKISYDVYLGPAFTLDTVHYAFKGIQDSILNATKGARFLNRNDQFSTLNLQNEKNRILTEFHNNGFYYYRPDYIKYYGDSINVKGKVKLLVIPDKNIPEKANRQWKIGRISAFVRKNQSGTSRNMAYDDTLVFRRLTYGYQGKTIPLKPRVMFRGFKFWTGQTYNESRVGTSLTNLSNMGIFSNVKFAFTPHDTTDTCSILDVRLDATMDKLIDVSLEANVSQRSNSQVGPDAAITFSKHNAFHYGETFSVKVSGAYYWKTENRSRENANRNDSYMFGADVSLSYPWLLMPKVDRLYFRYPASTKFSIGFTRENVAGAYRFNKMKFEMDYKFQTSKKVTHTFTPITLSLVETRELSEEYINASSQTAKLLTGLIQDEFIPAIAYKFQYNNSSDPGRTITTNFEGSVKESGNLINGILAACGRSYNEKEKRFVFNNFSQFVKVNAELRNKFILTPRSCIATRVNVGAIVPFGNSSITPFSESFYCGGANSIRAFSSRSIGPGGYMPEDNDNYLFHCGDFRLELNAEYRFPIFGNLFGAAFIDAGNVWNLRNKDVKLDEDDVINNAIKNKINEATLLDTKTFLNQVALGTGFGLRYDLSFLVLRLDVGIALHAPYDTGKSGYYNIRHFWKDGVAFHFAVGYPF